MYRCQISTWKDAPHDKSPGKCKLKQLWDTITHLFLEWPKSGTPNAEEDVEQRNSHSSLIRMQNVTATLEDILVTSDTTKFTLTIWSKKCIP